MDRLSWDDYFMRIAQLVSERTTCLRRKVGAILVRDRRVLATGYNGAPRGIPHCSDVGCLREQLGIPSGERQEICRGVHAEQNALVQAAFFGTAVAGSTLYCTHRPCATCAKLLINAGIAKVNIVDSYPDELADELLRQAGIEVRTLGK